MWWVCHMPVIQNKPNERGPSWNKNYLMQGPHQFMTEICSSNSVEEMPFQPPFQHVHVQMELHRLPASTGTFPSHLPTVSASSSSSLTCSPPHYSSFCHCFFPFPAWPLPPCCALLLGPCFHDPCCVQQMKEQQVGKPYKQRGMTVDWLLRKMEEVIRSCKLPLSL